MLGHDYSPESVTRATLVVFGGLTEELQSIASNALIKLMFGYWYVLRLNRVVG